jgi:uncharacterized membrane protein
VITNAARSSHPPFYYVLLRGWIQLAGVNDLTARIPSAFAGLLMIPVLYQAGRRLQNAKLGVGAAFLAAILPFQVAYSQEARMYAVLAMLTALAIYLMVRLLSENKPILWFATWIVWVLGVYTHYFFLFVIASFHLVWLTRLPRSRDLWRPLVLTDLGVLLAFLPQLSIFVQESQTALGPCYWLSKPNLLAAFTTIYFFVASYTVPETLNFTGMFLTLGWLALGFYESIVRRREHGHPGKVVSFLAIGAFSPLFIVLAISQVRPIFLERTLIICTPFLILFLAHSLLNRPRRSPIPLLAGGLAILLFISLQRYYLDPTVDKPALREVANEIESQRQSGDFLLHTTIGSYMPFLFYTTPEDNYLLWGGEDTDSCKPADTYELFGGSVIDRESVDQLGRFWLVVMFYRSIDYQQDQIRWFDEHLAFEKEMNVDDVLLRLYTPGRRTVSSTPTDPRRN